MNDLLAALASRRGRTAVDRAGHSVTLGVLAAIAFRWICFALMTVVAVWNESRPGTKIHDALLDLTPYIPWIDRWNYWIWILAWLPPSLIFIFVNHRRFARFMVTGGLLSLLRGLCIAATVLGPVRGPDLNALRDWDWTLRWEVVAQILNPLSVLTHGAAHIWLTKDLFFSGHAASCMLLLLYVWPHRGLRFTVALLSVPVTLSLFFGHVHYTIDVLGGWALAYLLFALRERRWAPSVPNQKSGDNFAQQSARLARRTDERIPGVFGGGPTPTASARASEIDGGLLVRDTSARS